jgi:hypothetical protein
MIDSLEMLLEERERQAKEWKPPQWKYNIELQEGGIIWHVYKDQSCIAKFKCPLNAARWLKDYRKDNE